MMTVVATADSDDIYRSLRYVGEPAPPGAVDTLRTAVLERFVGGKTQGAHAFSDVIRFRWSRSFVEPWALAE